MALATFPDIAPLVTKEYIKGKEFIKEKNVKFMKHDE